MRLYYFRTALAENRRKFAQLLSDYHESMAQVEEYKRQLVSTLVLLLIFSACV